MIHAKVIVMKISKCKKELARIISDNGGWPERALWAVQDNCIAFFLGGKPEYKSGDRCWYSNCLDGACVGTITRDEKVTNWHQTILSREEYFHLYPAAEPAQEPASEVKPIIEQLAADYRNAKDYADRKQQEADDAKAAADEALGELERAGEALGLVIGVAMPDPELVITDWRDLMERDVIWFDGDDEQAAGEYSVLEVEHANYGGNRAIRIDTIGNDYWIDVTDDWKFIRRP